MAKREKVVTTTFENNVLTFAVTGCGVLSLDIEKVSTANWERAVVLALKNRVLDAAALSRDTTTGASATPAEKFAEMKRIVEHLASGSTEWNIERAGGARAGKGKNAPATTGEVLAAMVALGKRKDLAAAEEAVRKLVAKHGGDFENMIARLAGSADIAGEVIRARAAARAGANAVDVDAMLEELEED